MMIRAVKTNQMNFLYMVYAYNKNYEINKVFEAKSDQNPSSDGANDIYHQQEQKYNTFSYDWLIKKILEHFEDK